MKVQISDTFTVTCSPTAGHSLLTEAGPHGSVVQPEPDGGSAGSGFLISLSQRNMHSWLHKTPLKSTVTISGRVKLARKLDVMSRKFN